MNRIVLVLVALVNVTCMADTFFLMNGTKSVTLKVDYNIGKSLNHELDVNGTFEIKEYKKVCLEITDEVVEVGIKEHEYVSLKNDLPCYKFKKLVLKDDSSKSLLTTIILKFKLDQVKNLITYKSSEEELVSLAGRNADPVLVSKSKYPNIKLDFSEFENINSINIEVNKEEVNYKTFSFNSLVLDDKLIIRIAEGTNHSYEKSFIIIK